MSDTTLALIRVRHQNFRVQKFGHFPIHVEHVPGTCPDFSTCVLSKKGIEEEEEDRGRSYDNNANFDMKEQEYD